MSNSVIMKTDEYVDGRIFWYALYVKSRHEFVVRDELVRKGMETLLPSAKRWRVWKDRRKLIEFPLFPGYLFVHVHADPDSYVNVLKARGAVTFVALESSRPTPVSEEEIDSLKTVLESGKELEVYPELKEGTMVRVRRGPLAGATGMLKRRDDGNQFVVNIRLLGRSVGIKIYDDDIEAA